MSRYGDVLEISNSEVQSYMDCRRRWWLQYVRGLKPKVTNPTGALPIGSRVHKVLEEGYSSPGRGEAAMSMLRQLLAKDLELAKTLGVEKQFLSEAELCFAMVEGFIEWAAEEGLDAEWEVVSHEEVVKAPPIDLRTDAFEHTRVVFKGKMDQRIRHLMDGSEWFRDWKTCQTLSTPTLHLDPQMRSYVMLLKLTQPDARVTGGQYVQLRKVKRTVRSKPPYFDVKPVVVSDADVGSFWRRTLGVLADMAATQVALERGGHHLDLAPPRPSRDCSWRCQFFEACPMFDDGGRVEDYLEARYDVGDPYSYYEDPLEEDRLELQTKGEG